MAFFDGLKRLLGFDDDEDEKKKKQQQQAAQNQNRSSSSNTAPTQNVNRQSNPAPFLQVSQRPDNGVNLVLPGMTQTTPTGFPTLLKKTQAPVTPSPSEQKKAAIDKIAEEEYVKTKAQREQGEGWFGRNILNKGHIEQDARALARSRATTKYLEANNWEKDDVSSSYMAETKQMQDKHSQQLINEANTLKKVAKVADKAGEIAQYVPVTGSVLNLGLAGAERLQKATGNDAAAADTANQRNKNEFGMTTEEFNALPKETQDKLRIVRGASYALSPLDFTGVGGLGKSALVAEGKNAAVQVAKKGAVELATKTALKEAAQAEAKKLAITTAVGTGVGIGSQAWIGGADSIDPLAALKGGVVAGGTSLLFDGGPSKRAAQVAAADAKEAALAATEIAPGVRSTNPNQAAHAAEQAVDNTPAYLRKEPTTVGAADSRAAMTGDSGLPDSMFSADAMGRSSAVPADPLDIPTFMRNQAPQKAASAKEQIAMLDERANMIRQNQGQVSKFNDKQEIAAAFRESPNKGNATAALIKNRNERIDPDAELQKTVAARAQASKELSDAEAAAKAQEEIDNAPKATDFKPDQMNEKEALALKNLDKAAKERVLTADEKAVRDTLKEKAEVIDAENNPKPEKPQAPDIAPAKVADTPQPASTIPAAFPVVEPLKKVQAATATAKTVTKAPVKAPQADLPLVKNQSSAGTGEVGKSQGKYARGQEYEKTSMDATRARGAEGAATESLETFTKKIEDANGMTGADRDTAVALQARQKPGTPEHRRLGDLINKHNTEAAQTLGTIEKTIRQTADANRITDRFVNKLYSSTDDTVKIKDTDFDGIIKRNEEFTASRDAQNAAVEAFNTDPSDANMKSVAEAFKKADEADRAAKFEEYKVASGFNKQSSNPKTAALVKKLEEDAGVYTMDWVDSSMLSSTRVMINNFINTLGVRNEEAMFGKAGAKIARAMTGTDIGGGSRKGAKIGVGLGMDNWRASMKLRQNADGNGLVKTIKNVVTSGNTLGDRNTYAAAYSGVYDHYRFKLKGEGFKGAELDRRSVVQSLTDPDKVALDYMNEALAANAMTSLTKGGTNAKFETSMTNTIGKLLGGTKASNVAAKALTRVTVGFPTVIGRSLVQGGKRATLGFPTAGRAVANALRKGDPAETAALIKQSVKEAGSGATMYATGAALGFAGVITGGYPSGNSSEAKAERERWEREGITENSIKIGDDYYSLPAALGVFSLPFMVGANAANNVKNGEPAGKDFVTDTVKTVLNAAPTDSAAKVMDFFQDLEAGNDVSKFVSSTAAGFTRAVTPLGSLTNQIAKMFDPNQNDTTQGDVMAQFLAKIQDGIPGLANDLPDKEVDGNKITNPDPIAKLFGAVSTEQKAGVETTADNRAKVAAQYQGLADAGAFDDKFRNLLDDDAKKVFDKMRNGKEPTEDEVKKVYSGLTKGLTETEDSRFLEDGDYDGNLTVLKIKRGLMEQDPTTRREQLEAYDNQIVRGEIYKANKTPYEMVKNYKDYSLEEWRDLGDPESDTYNQELYQKLYDLDSTMTDNGVSRKSGDATKPKYYAKEKKGGKGGSGGSGGDSTVKGNTIGDTPGLGKFSFGDLQPEKLSTAKIVKLQKIRSSDLVKKRTISMRKA